MPGSLWNGHGDDEDGTLPVRTIGGDERAAHRLDEAARDGKPKAGARLNLILFIGAMKLLEDTIDLLGGDPPALVGNFQFDEVVFLPGFNTYLGIARRIF